MFCYVQLFRSQNTDPKNLYWNIENVLISEEVCAEPNLLQKSHWRTFIFKIRSTIIHRQLICNKQETKQKKFVYSVILFIWFYFIRVRQNIKKCIFFFFNLTLHLNLILRSVMTKSLFISFELKTAMFLRRWFTSGICLKMIFIKKHATKFTEMF